jgi:hypothetical protein
MRGFFVFECRNTLLGVTTMQAKIMSKDGHKKLDLNRRKAIHERCLNCQGWYPKEATNCLSTNCSLHPFREGKGKQNPAQREKAIRQYCLSCMNNQIGEVGKCTVPDCPLFIFRKGGIEKAIKTSSLKTSKNRGIAFINSFQRE